MWAKLDFLTWISKLRKFNMGWRRMLVIFSYSLMDHSVDDNGDVNEEMLDFLSISYVLICSNSQGVLH